MKTKKNSMHTPGPWTVKPRERDGHADTIIAPNGRAFVQVGTHEAEEQVLDYPHENTQTANARLIAAAPELLEALKVALYELEEIAERPNARRYAAEASRAALAKAEGRPE